MLRLSDKLFLILTGSVGRMHPENMITKKIQMHEVVEEGFKTLINDKDNHAKILIEANPKSGDV